MNKLCKFSYGTHLARHVRCILNFHSTKTFLRAGASSSAKEFFLKPFLEQNSRHFLGFSSTSKCIFSTFRPCSPVSEGLPCRSKCFHGAQWQAHTRSAHQLRSRSFQAQTPFCARKGRECASGQARFAFFSVCFPWIPQ